MRELLNTLYIQTQDTHASLKNDTIYVEHEGEVKLRVPLHHLNAVYAFGVVHLSLPLLKKCAEDGKAVVLLEESGRFRARVTGKTNGNILLRRDQWLAHFSSSATAAIAKRFIAAKLQNSRQVLLRAARDHDVPDLRECAQVHASLLSVLEETYDVDILRGHEGLAAQRYFDSFQHLIRVPGKEFQFNGRTRRPPRDRVNALLSFLYSLGTADCVGALEGVGLDPQCGYLHVLRPGRPALALDLVEEFRSVIFDRLALRLINRRELVATDFESREGGSWSLTSDGRRKVFSAYQERKKEEVPHPLLKAKVPVGLLFHLQARLLARHLRGDLPEYTPYLV